MSWRDDLRFLVRIPFILARGCVLLLTVFFKFVFFFLTPLIGNGKWQKPTWLPRLARGWNGLEQWAQRHYVALLAGGGGVLLGAALIFVGYVWYQNRPRPIEVAPMELVSLTAQLVPPAATNYDVEKVRYSVAQLRFSASAAPIELVGKAVAQGIRLSPATAGQWTWRSDDTLVFTPVNDWRIGQEYKITIEPQQLLARQARLQQTEYIFTTAPFVAGIVNRELYQNPEKPLEKNVIFQVRFSHPVDAASFERSLDMALVAPEKYDISPIPYKFAVKYDDKKLNAWVRSEFVTLPRVDSDMVLRLAKNTVRSSLGGDPMRDEIAATQLVTSSYRDLVNNVFLTLAEDDNHAQRQVLGINLVDAIDIATVNRQVRAWLLPKDKTENVNGNTRVRREYRWSAHDDLAAAIALPEASRLELTPDEAATATSALVSFRYKADPRRYIYVEIGSDLQTVGGYKAKARTERVLNVPEFPRELRFSNQGAILALSGERKIGISSRNVAGVQVQLQRVLPSQIQHLFTLGSGPFARKTFAGYADARHFTESFMVTSAIAATAPGKIQNTGIDLSNYLIGGTQGVFLLSLSAWDPQTKKMVGNVVERRLVVVTDIGMIGKRTRDEAGGGAFDVFVQSITTGQPLDQVRVSLLGLNGKAIRSELSDINGHVRFTQLDQYRDEKQPTLFVAEKAGDMSLLPTRDQYYGDRELEFSRFDVGGDRGLGQPGRLDANLFSDRGLYRPGDSVYIGAIVRAGDWSLPVTGIPVKATVYDPRGAVFQVIPFTLDESGFNELTFTTSASAPTGGWRVELAIAKEYKDSQRHLYEGHVLGGISVKVREFEPDRMKVQLKLTPDRIKGWVKPADLRAEVIAENLFGAPAQNRRVATRLTASPASFTFSEYAGYSFYDGAADPKADSHFEIQLEDKTTDEAGRAALDLLLREHERASYDLSIIAEAFEAGSGRGVTAIARARVSPNDYLIGAKPDGDMGYIRKDSKRQLRFAAVAPDLKQREQNGLELSILEQKYVSVLTLQDSGVYKYESKLREILVKQQSLNIAATGTDYTVDSTRPGAYRLLVKNAAGDLLYQTYYTIAGNANLARSLERDAELDLKLARAEYRTGDTIEIAINAPYTGSGLITIEQDKVYAWKWFNSATTSSVQRITVPAGLQGTGYVNVQFVRNPNSDEIFMSPLSYSVAPFKVTPARESASLKLTSPAKVKPGKPVQFTVTTDQRQKVVVFAVDEGILQVAGYQTPQPLNYFFRKRALEVQSYQILDLILPEFSRFARLDMAPGGGMDSALDALNRNLNPFKRKTDKPVAYWSGITEVTGSKTFTYDVPDYFNGSLRVMAVAVSARKIGTAQSKTLVRDDFVLTPNVPFVAAPGDEFEVTLGVSNNIEDLAKTIPIKVALSASPQVKVLSGAQQTLSLAPKSESMLRFRLKAVAELGNATLRFVATYTDTDRQDKKYEARRTGTLSVRPLTPFRSVSQLGRMGGSETIANLRALYDEFASRQADVSYSPLVLSNALTRYLLNYQHYCSEQLVSGALAALLQQKHAREKMPLRREPDKVPAQFVHERVVQMLRARQNSQGAIGMWSSGEAGQAYVSVYAAHYLLEARENGVAVPADFMNALNRYLEQVAANNASTRLEDLRLRTYAIYLLTRQQRVTTSLLATLVKELQLHYRDTWRQDAAMLYLAASYKLLKMDKEAELAISEQWRALGRAYSEAWWSRDFYDPLVVNATAIYLIAAHFPELARQMPAQALENVVLMLRRNVYTTNSAAMALLALDRYSTYLNTRADKPLTIATVRKNEKPRVISTFADLTAHAEFTKNDTELLLGNETDLPAWYAITEEGFDREPDKAASKRGLEVAKSYTDAAGQPVTSVKLGDVVTVTLRVRSTSVEGVANVAVTDLIPGGFEIVRQEGNAAGSDWPFSYNDVREDRTIIYGTATKEMRTFVYRIKATNVGVYRLPQLLAEAMYDREIQGASADAGTITVLPAE